MSEPVPVDAPRPAPDVDAALRTLLRAHDIACPSCGHNMRHGDGRRCSECGKFAVPSISMSRAAIAQRNPRLIARDWARRCFAIAPGVTHACLGVSLSIACARERWNGFVPAPDAVVLAVAHLVLGAVLLSLAVVFLQFRRQQGRAARLVGVACGALLCVLFLPSALIGPVIVGWNI